MVYILPYSQRPHCTGDCHTKTILKEVKQQVLLGQTGPKGSHTHHTIVNPEIIGLASASHEARCSTGEPDDSPAKAPPSQPRMSSPGGRDA